MLEAIINAIKEAAGTISCANVRSNSIVTGFNLLATAVREAEPITEAGMTAVLSALPQVTGEVCEHVSGATLRHDSRCSLFSSAGTGFSA